jgi:hypothetical protein
MLALHIPLPYQRANKASSHQVASSAASRLIPQSSNSACCMCGCRCRYHTQLCSAVGVNRHFSSHHLIVLIHMCCAELRAWGGRWWCPRKWRRLCLALALIIYAVWPFRIWMATHTHTHQSTTVFAFASHPVSFLPSFGWKWKVLWYDAYGVLQINGSWNRLEELCA